MATPDAIGRPVPEGGQDPARGDAAGDPRDGRCEARPAPARRPRLATAALGTMLALSLTALAALPEAARAQVEIWSATLTVNELSDDRLGCSNSSSNPFCSNTSVLTDDAFSYAGTDYEILQILLHEDKRFEIELNKGPKPNLILDVDGTEFDFADATKVPVTVGGWRWTGTNLAWTKDDEVELKLTGPDIVPPERTSATTSTDGESVHIDFDDDLDSENLPSASAFRILVDGESVGLSAPTVSGKRVTIGLNDPVLSGETVSVSYADPTDNDDENAVQDTAGNDAASFSGYAVSNNSTLPAEVSLAPSGLRATAESSTDIVLEWIAPLRARGSPIQGYRIEVSTDGGNTWADEVADTGSRVPRLELSSRVPGAQYSFRVRAINGVGESMPSNVVMVTTPKSPPDAPASLRASADGHRAIVLEWDAPAFDGGSPITGYRIEMSSDGMSNWADLVSSTEDQKTVYEHGGLSPETTRHYRVSAINAEGPSEHSNVATATTPEATAPGVPRDPVASAIDQRTIELSWTVPLSDGGLDITGYRIEWSADGTGGSWTDLVLDTDRPNTFYIDTGLSPETTRFYRVYAINAEGISAESDVVMATTLPAGAPGAPRNLRTNVRGPTQIDLSWIVPANDGGSSITGYRIQWSADGATGSWTDLVGNTDTPDTAYIDTGLSAGETRHYRVFAINDKGQSGRSNVATATTPVAGTPDAPRNLRATAQGLSLIDLAWIPPADDRGSAITGYRIEVSDDEGESWSDLVSNTRNTDTTYEDDDLEPDTTRHYRVSAINENGPGLVSEVAMATTDAADTPSAPRNLRATAQGSTGIDLAWSAPPSDGGSPITGYRIEVSDDGGTSFTDLVADTGNTNTAYEHTDLPARTTRHYRVSAINVSGAGPASNVANATTATTPPGAPRDLRATARGHTLVDLEWIAPASDGGSPITGYRIEFSTDEGGSWADLVAETQDANETTYEHRGVSPGTTYHYRVSAINASGAGLASELAEATTADAGTPSAPRNLRATARGHALIDLEWIAPASDGSSPVTGYRIEVSTDGGENWSDVVADTGSTETRYEHRSRIPDTTYRYRVSAVNADGPGAASEFAEATTADAGRPGAPRSLVATPSGHTRIDLAWTAPASDGGADITGYRIEVSADTGTTWTEIVEDSGNLDTTWRHGGLSAGTTRHYRVSAINAVGTGRASNIAIATTAAVVTPSAPRDLRATRGDAEVTLTWRAPASNGGSALVRYEYRSGRDGEWIDAGLERSATVTRLVNGRSYRFAVRAVNGRGAGAVSSEVRVTPLGAPPPPRNLRAMPADRQVALRWDAPETNGGRTIIRYEYRVGEGGLWIDEGLARQVTVTGLVNGRSYRFSVRAVNELGDGTVASVTATAGRHDRVVRPWLTRSGRAAAEHVLGGVRSRLERPREAGVQGTLVGFGLGGGDVRAGSGGSWASGESPTVAPSWAGHIAGRRIEAPALGGHDLLRGSAFALNGDSAGGNSFGLWGGAAYSAFAGREGPLSLDGGVATATVGADFSLGALTAGLAVSHSRGGGSYDGEGVGGKVRSTLTGIYPYAGYAFRDWLSAWVAGGYGLGGVRLTPKGAASMEADVDLSMAATGMRGEVVSAYGGEGFELAVETETLWLRTGSDATAGIAETAADYRRMRLELEAAYVLDLGDGEIQNASLGFGVRHDAGDAESGFGMDIGGGLRWSDPAIGVSATFGARRVLTHEAEGFRDWGISGSFSYDSNPLSAVGFTFSFRHALGPDSPGAAPALPGRDSLGPLTAFDAGQGGRLDAELGYGLAVLGGAYAGTPHAGLSVGEGGRELWLGYRVRPVARVTGDVVLGVGNVRRKSSGGDPEAENVVGVRVRSRW